jgi:hypothetical protein
LEKQMRPARRTLVLAVIAASLTAAMGAAWPAQAGEHFYEGEVLNGTGKIEFVVQRKHGERKVKDFHADDLTETCTPGTSTFENFGIRGIEVHKRRFEERRNTEFRGSHIAVVEGRLRRGGRATGTVRLFRGFDEMPICDTGTLEWKARD